MSPLKTSNHKAIFSPHFQSAFGTISEHSSLQLFVAVFSANEEKLNSYNRPFLKQSPFLKPADVEVSEENAKNIFTTAESQKHTKNGSIALCKGLMPSRMHFV